MNWQSKVPREGTTPETQLWNILDEMISEKKVERFFRNTMIVTPFRDYPIQADVLVDGVLVIEVQGEYWHSKKTRAKKDQHKHECFEMMGYGVLWLYDDELNKATIPKYRETWRPVIKEWISRGLKWSFGIRCAWNYYQENINDYDKMVGNHPDLGLVSLIKDERRQ